MRYLLILLTMTLYSALYAQGGDSLFLYRRGSICSLMIGHRNQAFADDIEQAFRDMPVPDKYNDHSLGKRVFYTVEKKLKAKHTGKRKNLRINGDTNPSDMNEFDIILQRQYLASRLVSKWFCRQKQTGICSMNLIQERGYNNASELEKRLAAHSQRKEALLRDAGEELIGSTFVLVNDIRYIDKGVGTSIVGGIVSTAIQIGAAMQGVDTNGQADLGTVIASYKGFNVKIKTYLYQLEWNDEIAAYFYNNIYSDSDDEQKRIFFETNRDKFTLRFLGMQESSGKDISFMGINEKEPRQMVRKACQRALDENVANLQQQFDVFKIKAPLLGVEPLRSEIGKKEGITEKSRFEVLETVEDSKGHIDYRRIGVIRPVKDMIWDNRYMAKEEKAEGAELGFTTFEQVSGRGFCPGMLIREIK